MDPNDRPPVTSAREPLSLSDAQRFEIERMNRVIETCFSVEDLRRLCRQLLQAWMSQKAATLWVMRQGLDNPPRLQVTPDSLAAEDQAIEEGGPPASGPPSDP